MPVMSDTDRPDAGQPDTPGHDRAPGIDLADTLTLQAAAERAGVHERTVRRWITAGRLHAVKMGGQYRIASTDLEAAMGEHPDTARAPDTDTGQGRPDTGRDDRPVSGQARPDTGQPASVDLAPLADLIERQVRELAEMREAAAVWQVRAR